MRGLLIIQKANINFIVFGIKAVTGGIVENHPTYQPNVSKFFMTLLDVFLIPEEFAASHRVGAVIIQTRFSSPSLATIYFSRGPAIALYTQLSQ